MDKETLETQYLPKSFKKLQQCINKILAQHGDEEEQKEDETLERDKFKIFAKVLHNIQTTYITQQTKSKVDIVALIGSMKKDIKVMIGTSIPEEGIKSMITQIESMSGTLETNFSQLFNILKQIQEGINSI